MDSQTQKLECKKRINTTATQTYFRKRNLAPAIFRCICCSSWRANNRVERHDVHTGRGEHCQVKVVRDYELVVFGQSSSQSHTLRILVEALMRLVGPGKEEATRRAVLQAVGVRARVYVRKPGLYDTRQKGDPHFVDVISPPLRSPYVWPHKLRGYPGHVESVVHLIIRSCVRRLCERKVNRSVRT